jgi:hypothetical protein
MSDDEAEPAVVICAGCKKAPEKISDVRESAEVERMSPRDWVVKLDPTYNKRSGHFMCTDCYMERGISDPGYKAP